MLCSFTHSLCFLILQIYSVRYKHGPRTPTHNISDAHAHTQYWQCTHPHTILACYTRESIDQLRGFPQHVEWSQWMLKVVFVDTMFIKLNGNLLSTKCVSAGGSWITFMICMPWQLWKKTWLLGMFLTRCLLLAFSSWERKEAPSTARLLEKGLILKTYLKEA